MAFTERANAVPAVWVVGVVGRVRTVAGPLATVKLADVPLRVLVAAVKVVVCAL